MGSDSRLAESPGSIVCLWLALAVLLASMFHFLNVNATWLKPFGRDFLGWLRSPSIAGGPTVPAGWPLWLGAVLLAGLAAWEASRLALSGTALAHDLIARLGTSILLAAALLGYASTIAVVMGRFERWTVLTILGAVTLALIGASRFWRWRHKDAATRGSALPTRPKMVIGHPAIAKWLGISMVIGVVGFSLVHAIMAPITEWDATIYHAATAKLWFLNGPDPPLTYGPSVGREISANFPPLFPAVGATAYSIVGRFDDVYLRVVSPIVAIGLTLVTFSYARLHSGSNIAWWVVILALGSPLLVLYTVWPTNYMMLASLTVLVLMFCELAAVSGSKFAWGAAGAFAGFAILTNFYGWLSLGFAAIAVLSWRRSWPGVFGLAIFGTVALAIAAPWLLRDWVRLGDPVYPLGSPIFHGAGLIQPLWSASQAEIRQNAVGQQFGNATGLRLRAVEVALAFESRYLLACGLVLGLVVGLWRAVFRDRRAIYLSASLLILVVGALAPGWYWLRALLPLVPVGAILTGLALESASGWALTTRLKRGVGTFVGSWWAPALIGAGLLSFVSSVSLSIAGPSQGLWTTQLGPTSVFMRPVRNLGSSDAQIYTDFGSDAECWRWLNAHLGQRDNVATFEIRVYYLDRPANLFYLDGIEAIPLLKLRTPASVSSYLLAHNVRYILIPGWSVGSSVTRHPAVDLLPLTQMLGRPGGFPVVAQFGSTTLYSSVPMAG